MTKFSPLSPDPYIKMNQGWRLDSPRIAFNGGDLSHSRMAYWGLQRNVEFGVKEL